MNVLRLMSVSFAFAEREVLWDVSLSLEEGKVLVLLGPNGAGKSTLLDICLGWKKPTAGEVILAGKPLSDYSPRKRGQAVSLVPQRENVRFNFSCLDYVMLGRAPYLSPLASPGRADVEIAREALDAAGIPHLENRQITAVSGGEYQLVLIARSLAQQPDILLLDEPTSQLDPAHRITVLRTLQKLSKRDISILLTSHSPETAALIADEVCLLKEGTIAYSGPAEEVLTDEILQSVYGVPFTVRWSEGKPQFIWDL